MFVRKYWPKVNRIFLKGKMAPYTMAVRKINGRILLCPLFIYLCNYACIFFYFY
jgi:hypothetical protein